MNDRSQALEAKFRKQFSRWSALVWAGLLEFHLPKLIEGNLKGLSQDESDQVVENYLTLCAEAIGAGKLYPHGPEKFPNLYSLFFEKLIPEQLPAITGLRAQLEKLAEIWNLCEGVDREPSWVSVLLLAKLLEIQSLEDLEGVKRSLQSDLDPPKVSGVNENSKPEDFTLRSYRLVENGFFLPKRIQWIAPRLVSIYGGTPQGERVVTIHLEKTGRILGVEKAAFSEQDVQLASRLSTWSSLLESAPFQLGCEDILPGTIGVAAVFRESQKLHVWHHKSSIDLESKA